MITKTDLQEAIAECLGQRNPDANTCIKLAAYYTIMDNLYPQETAEPKVTRYSYAPASVGKVMYQGKSKFADAIIDRNPDDVWKIMDELMDALSVLSPSLYHSVLDKIKEL